MKQKVEVFLDKDNMEFLKDFSKNLELNISQSVNRIVTEYRRLSTIEDELRRYRHDTEIERGVKVLLEIANTYLHLSGENVFIPTSQLKHPTLEKAELNVRSELAHKKQRKDNRKRIER